MSRLLSYMNKDRIEYLRSHTNLICVVVIICCASMVLLSTAYMPILLEKAMEVSDLMSSDMSVSSFMEKFFPNDLKGSLGIFSADIGVFYSLTIIVLTYSILPNEISTGRLILPLCAGYTRNTIFISKQFVYSFLCAVPVFPFYILYFYIGSTFLDINYSFELAVINALLLSLSEFSIVYFTIALSVLYKYKLLCLATMSFTVMVAPDILSFFKFGDYFPTHILTYLYRSDENLQGLIIPVIVLLSLFVCVDFLVIKKQFSVDVDERR